MYPLPKGSLRSSDCIKGNSFRLFIQASADAYSFNASDLDRTPQLNCFASLCNCRERSEGYRGRQTPKKFYLLRYRQINIVFVSAEYLYL